MLFLGKTEALAVCLTARIGLVRPPRQNWHRRPPERSPASDSVSSWGWIVRAHSAFAAWNTGGSIFIVQGLLLIFRAFLTVQARTGPPGITRRREFRPGVRHEEQSMVFQKPGRLVCGKVPGLNNLAAAGSYLCRHFLGGARSPSAAVEPR